MSPIEAASEAGSKTAGRVQGRYGATSLFNAMFVEEKLVHAVCMFAFTGTWALDVASLVDGGIASVPIDSQPFMHPAQRRFISFDPTANGITNWNYHVGVGIVAGADLTYRVELICSNDYTCSPTEGYPDGRCDCNYLNAEKRQLLQISGGTGSLKAGELLDKEVFQNVMAPYRFDKVELTYEYRDANSETQIKKLTRTLVQKGGPAPAFCAMELLDLQYRCSIGFGDDYFARFSGDPMPAYQAGQDRFYLNEQIKFSVPIVQGYPEQKPLGCTTACNFTKYLVYEVKNNQYKATIDHNDPQKCNAATQAGQYKL